MGSCHEFSPCRRAERCHLRETEQRAGRSRVANAGQVSVALVVAIEELRPLRNTPVTIRTSTAGEHYVTAFVNAVLEHLLFDLNVVCGSQMQPGTAHLFHRLQRLPFESRSFRGD